MSIKNSYQNNGSMKNSKFKHYSILVIILFSFWVSLSGVIEAKFLTIGLVTALVATWATGALLRLPSTDGKGFFYVFDLPYIKYFSYLAWLLKEIIKSNIDILKILLNPKMPINPQIIKFKKSMKNPIAHVTLGNSITLTPGTVTLDIEGEDTYVIHAINDATAEALVPKNGEGEMQQRVAALFGEELGQGVRSY